MNPEEPILARKTGQDVKQYEPKLRRLLSQWLPEFGNLLVASIIFSSIVAILLVYNSKEQPNNFSFNALIALCATFLRSALLSIVEEGMIVSVLEPKFNAIAVTGQLKWTWYRNAHPRSSRCA